MTQREARIPSLSTTTAHEMSVAVSTIPVAAVAAVGSTALNPSTRIVRDSAAGGPSGLHAHDSQHPAEGAPETGHSQSEDQAAHADAHAHAHGHHGHAHAHNRGPRAKAIAEARHFVYHNAYGNLNTMNQKGVFSGFPTSQVEYYADCADDEASLLFIRVDMSGAFRNIDNGSAASLTIRTGDRPHGIAPIELASQPRIVLYGEFEHADPSVSERERFFEIHPDAREWAPGKTGFHATQWTKFIISGIYYIGGFGDHHYIGQIPVDKYVAVEVDTASDGEIESARAVSSTAAATTEEPRSMLSRLSLGFLG